MAYDLVGASMIQLVERTELAEPFALEDAPLFHQGDAADSMYAIAEGEVEILTRTPGDDVVAIGRLGPGAVLGELALIDGGTRSATARATRRTRGFRLSRHAFATLRAARRPVSGELLRRLAAMTCERIRARVADVTATLGGAGPLRFSIREDVDRARWRPVAAPAVDARTAALLPLFSGLAPSRCAALIERGTALELDRGERVAIAGRPADAVLIVMRGAVSLFVTRDAAGERCGLAAPGTIVSTVAVVDGGPVPLDAAAREHSVLLSIPTAELGRLRAAGDELGWMLDDALMRELVRELRLVTLQLARLAAHGRVATASAS